MAKRNDKAVLVLAGAIILAGVAIVSFYFGKTSTRQPISGEATNGTQYHFPTPDETANWKTYRNDTFKFSLQYPSLWYFFEGSTKEIINIANFDPTTRNPSTKMSPGELRINITIGDKEHVSLPIETTTPFEIGGVKAQQLTQVAGEFKSNSAALGITKERTIFIDRDTVRLRIAVSLSDQDGTKEKLVDKILSTFKFLNNIKVSPDPTPQTSLKYVLPSGWKTIGDTVQTLELGYDSNSFVAIAHDKNITLGYKDHPGSFGVSLFPYDGGSRHQFIYKQLGMTDPKKDQMSGYHEKNYVYNGWSCLVLYGLAYSASGTTWGMCAVSATQALFISGPAGESGTEALIQTVRMLK
jgi:hypothetical protein